MDAIRVANAPCSWGSLEFDGMQGETITCDRMLDELVETGYAGTELGDWGFMPTAPDALRAALQQRGVTMVGAFVPVAFRHEAAHAPGIEAALRVARLIAAVAAPDHAPWLILADDNGGNAVRTRHAGRIAPEMGLSAEEWRTFATGVERAAHAIHEETGLRTAFHHHCAGYVETPEEITRLLEMTNPTLVGLVFDTGHYAYGADDRDGAQVRDALERFADRIRHIHFKDFDPAVADAARLENLDYFQAVARGVFCELGKGCVDFAHTVDWLRRRGYRGWIVVEQDVLPGMGMPRESARRNREFLKTLGL
ncbi:MAG TPA: xylose isomerase [Candidatus Hydrogenedentes bacterium]|nr:xylose isomerase [Candidatus Hydrogenedentota bacterium]